MRGQSKPLCQVPFLSTYHKQSSFPLTAKHNTKCKAGWWFWVDDQIGHRNTEQRRMAMKWKNETLFSFYSQVLKNILSLCHDTFILFIQSEILLCSALRYKINIYLFILHACALLSLHLSNSSAKHSHPELFKTSLMQKDKIWSRH